MIRGMKPEHKGVHGRLLNQYYPRGPGIAVMPNLAVSYSVTRAWLSRQYRFPPTEAALVIEVKDPAPNMPRPRERFVLTMTRRDLLRFVRMAERHLGLAALEALE